MSKPLLRFLQSPLTLDLNDQSAYFLYPDFTPPSENTIPLIASGTSANRRGGGKKMGERADDRTITFTVNVRKTSTGNIAAAVNAIKYFVGLAGNDARPLYLEWAADTDVAPRPLWGQGPSRFYTVLYGTVALAPSYLVGNRKDTDVDVTVSLVVGPFALGQPQRLASALGGLLLDNYGTTDGRGRGLVVPEATTNKMTNPVFGNATYDTGWTFGAELIDTKNIDPRFLLPGTVASLKAIDTGADGTAAQSINAGNTNTHTLSFYAKRDDGAAVTASDVVPYYGGSKTADAYTSVGDGWYRVRWTGAGINAGTATGANIVGNRGVYLTGFQFEEKSYVTPLCYGDLLGCAWTGTVHASTSTRTAGRARVPLIDCFNRAQGTFRIVYKFSVAAGTLTAQRLMSIDCTGTMAIGFVSSTTLFFQDGTNTASAAVASAVPGDVVVVHATYGPSGLAIYRNGALIDTDATYSPPVDGSYMYIGSSTAAATQGNGTLMDFTTYAQALTTAEVLADYTNLIAVASDDQRVGAIPWLWTKDGDDVVDNHDDSGEDNWCVVGGVPGSVEAKTEFLINVGTNYHTDGAIWLWLNDLAHFSPPSYWQYSDRSGTVDANSSGGAYETPGVEVVVGSYDTWTWTFTPTDIRPLIGKEIMLITRLADTGTGLQITPNVVYGNLATIPAYKSVTTDSTFRLYITNSILVDDNVTPDDTTVEIWLGARRLTAAQVPAADFFIIATRPYLTIKKRASTSGVDVDILLDGERAKLLDAATGKLDHFASVTGDVLELHPGRVNIVGFASADIGTAMTIARTATFSRVRVTPRYALL